MNAQLLWQFDSVFFSATGCDDNATRPKNGGKETKKNALKHN